MAGLLTRLKQPKPDISVAKLACGIKKLLDYAITQHRKEHYGAVPKRIVLHSELTQDVYIALGPHGSIVRDRYGNLLYRDVSIVLSDGADTPYLVTHRNEIEWL